MSLYIYIYIYSVVRSDNQYHAQSHCMPVFFLCLISPSQKSCIVLTFMVNEILAWLFMAIYIVLQLLLPVLQSITSPVMDSGEPRDLSSYSPQNLEIQPVMLLAINPSHAVGDNSGQANEIFKIVTLTVLTSHLSKHILATLPVLLTDFRLCTKERF